MRVTTSFVLRLKSQELVAQTKEAHKSESIRSEKGPHLAGRAKPGRPRVLILSPTSELAQQVMRKFITDLDYSN